MIQRDRCNSNEWYGAADSTLEDRIYYCHNWRADVSAIDSVAKRPVAGGVQVVPH